MHDIRFIRENPAAFDRGLARRGLEPQAERLIALDEKRRTAIQAAEAAQARRNAASKEIGEAKKAKDEERAKGLLAEVAELKTPFPRWKRLRKKPPKSSTPRSPKFPICRSTKCPTAKTQTTMSSITGLERNATTRSRRSSISSLVKRSAQMDFEAAAKLSGARFVVLKKGLARLERALGQFMLDVHTSEPHNYTEVSPPLLVRDEAMFGTAQLPKFEDDQFQRTQTNVP